MPRFVLIAAVSEYLDGEMSLPGVKRDAERLRSTLTDCADGGVHRFFWLADNEVSKGRILNELQEIANQAGATDQVIVYFGGHGQREWDTATQRRKYYLLPHDATFASVTTHGLSTDDLGAALHDIKAQELVVILDCCHSGGMVNFQWSQPILNELLEGWRNYYVIAASRGREGVPDDNSGGFFMKAFCDALQGEGIVPDEQSRISAQMAWSRAADVMRLGHKQVPVSAGISSPIYLTRCTPVGSNTSGSTASPIVSKKDHVEKGETEESEVVVNSRDVNIVKGVTGGRDVNIVINPPPLREAPPSVPLSNEGSFPPPRIKITTIEDIPVRKRWLRTIIPLYVRGKVDGIAGNLLSWHVLVLDRPLSSKYWWTGLDLPFGH